MAPAVTVPRSSSEADVPPTGSAADNPLDSEAHCDEYLALHPNTKYRHQRRLRCGE